MSSFNPLSTLCCSALELSVCALCCCAADRTQRTVYYDRSPKQEVQYTRMYPQPIEQQPANFRL